MSTHTSKRLGGVAAAFVLCWPVVAWCQASRSDLLNSIHDEDTLVAASRRLFESKGDIAALHAALDSTNTHVRWAAAMTLVGNGPSPSRPERVVPLLVEAIKHGGPGVRTLAFQQLGSMAWSYKGYRDVCAPVVNEGVIAGLKDSEYTVSDAAATALGRCPSLPVAIAAREIAASHGRLQLIWNLGSRGTEAKGASNELIQALDDRHSDVREAAAETLRSAGVAPELYVPSILEVLAKGDDYEAYDKLIAVAPAAARWTPEIIRMLEEPHRFSRRQLRFVLNRIGTEEARRAASRDRAKERVTEAVPAVAFMAVLFAASALVIKNNWGVLLAYLFLALPFVGFAISDNDDAKFQAMWAAPFFSAFGVVSGFFFGRGESSRHKRRIGLIGAALSVIVLVGSVLLILGTLIALAPLGAG